MILPIKRYKVFESYRDDEDDDNNVQEYDYETLVEFSDGLDTKKGFIFDFNEYDNTYTIRDAYDRDIYYKDIYCDDIRDRCNMEQLFPIGTKVYRYDDSTNSLYEVVRYNNDGHYRIKNTITNKYRNIISPMLIGINENPWEEWEGDLFEEYNYDNDEFEVGDKVRCVYDCEYYGMLGVIKFKDAYLSGKYSYTVKFDNKSMATFYKTSSLELVDDKPENPWEEWDGDLLEKNDIKRYTENYKNDLYIKNQKVI